MTISDKVKNLFTLNDRIKHGSVITANLVQTITGTYKLEGDTAPGRSETNKWDACIDTIHDHMEDQEMILETSYPLCCPPNNHNVIGYTERLTIPILVKNPLYKATLVFLPKGEDNNHRWLFTVSDPDYIAGFNNGCNRYAWGYNLDKLADIASKAAHIDHDLVKPAFDMLGDRLRHRIRQSHWRA